MLQLIDRRPNSRGKSAVNRERFLRRYKAQIQGAVKKMIGERRIADMEKGGEVRVPRKDISEPQFGFGHGGDREFVLPGNREYVAGDKIPRPKARASGRGSGDEGGTGESEDAFVFSLSREEFMQIFFDDLELPNLARTAIGRSERKKSVRAALRRPASGEPCRHPDAQAVARPADRARRRIEARDAELDAAFAHAVALGQGRRGGAHRRGSRAPRAAPRHSSRSSTSRTLRYPQPRASVRSRSRAPAMFCPDGRLGRRWTRTRKTSRSASSRCSISS
jgi:uncharacterized sporulation protein YeaH/YhbH (DUF444 family)